MPASLCSILTRPFHLARGVHTVRHRCVRTCTRLCWGKASLNGTCARQRQRVCSPVSSTLRSHIVQVVALYIKLESLSAKTAHHGSALTWGLAECVAFGGFANQVMGMVDMGGIRRDVVRHFIFTGPDGKSKPP